MADAEVLRRFHEQFDRLIEVVKESNSRIVSDNPDEFFSNHQNVLIKAYLVSACSVLEAFVQELVYECYQVFSERARGANLPHNAVLWEIPKMANDEKSLRYVSFELGRSRRDVSNLVSASYHKTITAFRKIGVCIEDDAAVGLHKDVISSVVEKRNNIVHHNDEASDISLSDVVSYIGAFKEYSAAIYAVVKSDPFLVGEFQ